jgi:dTMP kinase
MQPKFITFEGIDGAGKSTHIAATVAQLRAAGREVVQTREPGGTDLAEELRRYILCKPMAATTELLLMFASRREHLEQKIWPALKSGKWVVCDRFTDSTMAYQGYGRNLGISLVSELARLAHPDFSPDLTLWFDVSPEVAAQRIETGRGVTDRFEREQAAFFERVRNGYASIAAREPERVKRVNSEETLEKVALNVQRHIAALL